MSGLIGAIKHAAERVEHGLQGAENTVIGILQPDRRHDSIEEKEQDQIRTEICDSHRFQSFADERSQNFVKWHIDGHDYLYAISSMLASARECIFILDWWLTPELYLRRPAAYNPEWRLDRVLKRKAEQGVKVYVIVYKEVTQTMSMSSAHTKHALEDLHPNIACMRHPDHIGSKDDVEFWSHHEKLVVVDNHIAGLGGIDLCFGRWDTHTHPLADVHPTKLEDTLFPGQDYNNARILDFQDVGEYVSNGLSVVESPRMPWHDISITIVGPVVLDYVQHFVERWNEIKKRKYRHHERYDWLALPHDVSASPNEAVVRHPHREEWSRIGRAFKQRFHLTNTRIMDDFEDKAELVKYGRKPWGTCRAQAVRSVSDWSHGVLTEHSIQNAYIDLITAAEHFIYIENQFFISNTQDDGVVKNKIAKAIVQRIIRAGEQGAKFKVIVVIPEVPAFAGQVKDESSVRTIMAAQYRTMNRGGHSIYEEVRRAGYEPSDYIRFYHLRSYDRINDPYDSLIKKMEENSGIKFHQAMTALARQWVGPSDGPSDPVSVSVVVPTGKALTEPSAVGTKNETKKETYPLPATLEEAKTIIENFQRGAEGIRGDSDISDTVGQHALLDNTSLSDEKWEGTEEEEKNSYVSELCYIHSKLMIVDDRKVLIGSANFNDRSQRGDGDSEIAVVVEDEDLLDSQMDGQPYQVARFAASLRRKLFREHLGLIPPQMCTRDEEVTPFMRPAPVANEDETGSEFDALVADPISDQTLSLWNDTARKNREIFTELFRPIPTNLVRDWNAYSNYVPKVLTDHVVPEVPLERVKERLSNVKGGLVECPMDFLIDQKDFCEGPDWLGLNPALPIYL